MSYDAIETGPLGRPVEGYEFAQAGVFTRVTSAATAQVFAGNTYEPLSMSRTEPVQGNEPTAGEIRVTVPSSFDIAEQFRGTIPSSLPSLTIFQKHLNDGVAETVTYWKGTVVSCSMGGRAAELLCHPPTTRFSLIMPRRVYAASCSHQLYDSACGVAQGTYRYIGTLTAVDASGLLWTIAGLRVGAAAIDTAQSLGLTAQELDDFWQRGFIGVTDSPAEFRSIVKTDVGGDPNTVGISIPFRTAGVGAAIEVYAGCGHSLDFCNRKFKNALRFGGFPYVPTQNPFGAELDSGLSNRPGAAPNTTSKWRG